MSWLGTIPEPFLSRPARAFVAGIALLGVVALMTLSVPAEPLAIDQSWSEAMQDIRTPLLTDVALVFNALGRGLGRALSLTAVAVVVFPRRRWGALLAFATTEVLTSLSHAAYAGATCVALVLLLTVPGPRRRWGWALAALGVLGMAWSRTYLQVHWLSDVVGGSLLGIGIALAVFGGAQLLIRMHRLPRDPVVPLRGQRR